MWTEGDGTGMAIYATMEEIIPGNVTVNNTGGSSTEQVATVAG